MIPFGLMIGLGAKKRIYRKEIIFKRSLKVSSCIRSVETNIRSLAFGTFVGGFITALQKPRS